MRWIFKFSAKTDFLSVDLWGFWLYWTSTDITYAGIALHTVMLSRRDYLLSYLARAGSGRVVYYMAKNLRCLTKIVLICKRRKKRRLRDSNPRIGFPTSSFRGWRNRPLCQISTTNDSGRIRTCGPAYTDLPDSSRMHSSTMRRCRNTPGESRTHIPYGIRILSPVHIPFCYRGKVGGVGLEPTMFRM